MKQKQKIVVAMSGGVDSSTVAALLKEQGHEVIGITLQLYDSSITPKKKGACCAGQDIYDAKVAADKIGIPHYTLDYEKVFNQKVINNFADSYLRGETPIPCIECNQNVKFADLLKATKELGADFLATGHYVRTIIEDGHNKLLKGIDGEKDQSYFLFATTTEQLNNLMFPLGHMRKHETRALAHKYNLEIADKPESQDICFVPDGNYFNLIKKLRPDAHQEGDIIHINGKVLGRHQGIAGYTIGQRKGLEISYRNPLYVIKIDTEKNQVIVGEKEALLNNKLKIRDLNWLAQDIDLKNEISCAVRLRSNHKEIPAKIKYLGSKTAEVQLSEPYLGITPGQACVMYHDDRVLGGGWIMREGQ